MRGLVIVLALGWCARAAAQEPEPLTVGVYAPLVHFPNSAARNQFAADVAQALQQATGLPMRGRGFSQGFGGAAVDFAIVDAPYLARAGHEPLAQATWRGKPARSMVLVVGAAVEGRNIGEIEGATLANPPVPNAEGFVGGFLLQRQVAPGYFRPARRTPADVQGALSLVQLGKASATFTFQGTEGGLRRVFVSRPVPLPVFVKVRADLPADTVEKIRAALPGVRVANSVFDGFGRWDAGPHKVLRGALRGSSSRAPPSPVSAAPRGRLPAVPSYLDVGRPTLVMPPAAGDLAVPEPPTDAF